MTALERKPPPLQPRERKTLTESIEYAHTCKLDAPPGNLQPSPPPGDGWRLAAMTYGNGRLHYAWARKVGT